jgi:hypothetical protein
MKNSVFWHVTPRGFLLRIDVLEEGVASIITVKVSELGTALAATSS